MPGEGGVGTLLTLIGLFEGDKKKKMYGDLYVSEGVKYSKLKEELALAIFEELKPVREKRQKLQDDPGFVEEVLVEGAKKAGEVAGATLLETKKAMGLI